MSIQILQKEIPSTDGIHTLRGKMYLPEGEPKAVIQISHGMVEHIGRYDNFMTYLAENGFAVCGHDHLGHGQTAQNDEELGYFAEKNGWKLVVDDVHAFGVAAMRDFPGKKHFLLGHSMGSFIARNAVVAYPTDFDAFVIMGTGGPNPASGLGLFLTSFIGSIKGGRHISALAENAAFSTYNKRTGSDNPSAWITSDEEMLARHDADKYCMFKFTVSAMHDLVELQSRANKGKWFRSVPRELPILLVAGDADPVGNYGRGVTKVYKKLCAADVSDVTLKLYHGMRHEILNEIGKDEVYADLLGFFNSKVK